jgi:hypothetical protein
MPSHIFRRNFADQPISLRIPFVMPGELSLAENQSGIEYPPGAFAYNRDKPFECHRMLARFTAFGAGGVQLAVQPEQKTLAALVRIKVVDFSKSNQFTQNAVLASAFMKDNELTWEWEDPYTVVRAEGFQVTLDTLDFDLLPALATPIETIRTEITFEGFQLVVAAASETR